VSTNFFGDGARLHHIGIAVRKIENDFGDEGVFQDEYQKVFIQFNKIGNTRFEFIAPLGADSPVTKFLDRGVHTYHACFEVDSLESSIIHAKKYGFRLIDNIVRAPAMNNSRIAWLFSIKFGLFELVEASQPF